MAAPKKRTLHLMHSSMAFSQSQGGFEADIRRSLGREPDILTTTESVQFSGVFDRVCRSMGYTPVQHQYKACRIAVRTSEQGIRVKNQGRVFILSGKAGVYPDTTINWVVVNFHGVTIYHHVAHWVPKHSANYHENHRKISNAMVTQVRLHGKQKNLSFFAGDINEDDDPDGRLRGTQFNQIMRQGGLMTIWDEHRVYPPTMGGGSRTIDVIGKWKVDHVEGKRYKLWPSQNSDHRPVSAWYEIDMKKTQDEQSGNQSGSNNSGGSGGGPDGGSPNQDTPTDSDHSGDPVDDDFYATGGNVSWADYLDDTIYDLPQAVDDSDTTNG